MDLRHHVAAFLALVVPACASNDVDAGPATDGSETSSGPTTTSESDDDSTGIDAESTAPYSDTSGDGDESSTGASGLPTAVGEEYFVAQAGELHVFADEGVLVNDSHSGGSPLTVTAADAASANGATVTVLEDGSFDFVPAASQWGEDSFEYTVADDAGNTATALVTVVVTPVGIPLSSIADGVGGFALDGEDFQNYAGSAVAGGDIDHDGVGDVVVSAQSFADHVGRTYVVFGGDTPRSTALSDLIDADAAVAFTGEQVSQQSGRAMDVVGDVNGDGIDDILIGAWDTFIDDTFQAGRSYVVFGSAEPSSIDLDAITDGEGGFAIDGTFENEHTGYLVSAAGDVDGDGLADIVIGTYHSFAQADEPDVAFVVFGKADTDRVALADVRAGVGGFAIVGESAGEYLEVGDAGDLDGDGRSDLLIGSPLNGAAGERAGRAYVVFGPDVTDEIALADVAAGVGGWSIDGQAADDLLGASVDGVGDVNGDGLSDIAFGAGGAPYGNQSGRSYVISGTGDRTPAAIADIVDGDGGFVIDGGTSGDRAGIVHHAGDVNADGLADLVIGGTGGLPEPTPVHVVFGSARPQALTLDDVANGEGGYAIIPEPGSGCCVLARGAGDVDADGVDDLVLGVPYALGSVGRAYVVHGVRTQP